LGGQPPYHHPVFVLTHHQRDSVKMEGGTTFHFVTDGIESALAQAREAAGSRDVSLGGGASTVQQYLALGLVDELLISLVPVFLGDGTRLFDNMGASTHDQSRQRWSKRLVLHTSATALLPDAFATGRLVHELSATEQRL
jgi:dihydrofolate reductase